MPDSFTLKSGMLILVPSDGGYAPDATNPELLLVGPRVDSFGSNQVIVYGVGEENYDPSRTRIIGAEIWADSVQVLDPKRLSDYLDLLTKTPTHAFHRDEKMQQLKKNPVFVFKAIEELIPPEPDVEIPAPEPRQPEERPRRRSLWSLLKRVGSGG